MKGVAAGRVCVSGVPASHYPSGYFQNSFNLLHWYSSYLFFLSSFCYCHNLALVTKYMWFQVLYIFMAFVVLCICSIIIVFLKFISFLEFWPERWALFFFSRLGLHLLPVLVCTLWDHFLLFLLHGFSHASLQSFSFSCVLVACPSILLVLYTLSLYWLVFPLRTFISFL